MMTTILAAAALILQASPGHAGMQAAHESPHTASADEGAVRAVLARYKSAIERLDATGTEALFIADSAIFETGGVEGTYQQYLAHHLGPELAEFRSFAFSDYTVSVRLEGDLALATETYNYRIETRTGEVATRKGVATSVLARTADGWKIRVMHNSARKPKGS